MIIQMYFIQCKYRFKNWPKLNMGREHSTPKRKIKNQPSWLALSRIRRTRSFHVVLQRTAKKCTKIQNVRAVLLFCSLNLLFGDVLVAVAVVVCLSSLLTLGSKTLDSPNTLESFRKG